MIDLSTIDAVEDSAREGDTLLLRCSTILALCQAARRALQPAGDVEAMIEGLRREHAAKCPCHHESGHVNFHGDDPAECNCEDDICEWNARVDAAIAAVRAALGKREGVTVGQR